MFRSLLLLAAAALVAGRPSEGVPPAEMCSLPEVRGHCRALLPRWRYDPTTGKCYEFKFGGCDGNGNNFLTQTQCLSVCAGV